jgi:hypothetical protein
MRLSCCHPRLSEEAQVALVLSILCGFSVDEIASGFLSLSGRAAIGKRIQRAKKVRVKEAVRYCGTERLFGTIAGRPPRALLPCRPSIRALTALCLRQEVASASGVAAHQDPRSA